MPRQVFFFCTLYDGNVTVIYRCKTETELCCGRGCCLSDPVYDSVWTHWYFCFFDPNHKLNKIWDFSRLGIVLFVALLIIIALVMSLTSCRPNPVYTENSSTGTVSRYGIRHILGVQNSARVNTVADTNVTCGSTGLIQPLVNKFSRSRFGWNVAPLLAHLLKSSVLVVALFPGDLEFALFPTPLHFLLAKNHQLQRVFFLYWVSCQFVWVIYYFDDNFLQLLTHLREQSSPLITQAFTFKSKFEKLSLKNYDF